MKDTWASGAIELLKHAEDHIVLNTSFDRKIAFISIDNCVELTLKSFLSLPKRFSGETRPTKNELDNAFNSFPSLLDLIEKYASEKLDGVEINDIEHYHRIRNTLYHQGTGLSVKEEYVQLYFSIAKILLKNLFEIEITYTNNNNDNSIYSDILIGWSQIEQLINEILSQRGNDSQSNFKWKIFQTKEYASLETIELINSIRNERNRIAHSTSFDKKPDQNILNQINNVKKELKEIFDSYSKDKQSDFYFYPSLSKVSGELTLQKFFGPPNYGEDPVNDSRETAYILRLKYPINVISEKDKIEEGDFDYTKLNINEIQLVFQEKPENLINKNVNVEGIFFGARTGHHRTPVLLDVKKITKI